MKRGFTFLMLIIVFASFSYAKDFQIYLGIGYSEGISEFFDESEVKFLYDGKTLTDKRKSTIGLSFNININIPISEKLSLFPGFSTNAGFQDYSSKETPVTQTSTNLSESYHFQLYNGEVSALYHLVNLSKEIHLKLLGGISYTVFKSDSKMDVENENYFGSQFGLAIHFKQKSQFDLLTLVTYHHAFSDTMPSYLKGQAGLVIKF